MSEDSIKMSNLIMRILFESGLYSNADSICDFTVLSVPKCFVSFFFCFLYRMQIFALNFEIVIVIFSKQTILKTRF